MKFIVKNLTKRIKIWLGQEIELSDHTSQKSQNLSIYGEIISVDEANRKILVDTLKEIQYRAGNGNFSFIKQIKSEYIEINSLIENLRDLGYKVEKLKSTIEFPEIYLIISWAKEKVD